jgi:hypothetical protein
MHKVVPSGNILCQSLSLDFFLPNSTASYTFASYQVVFIFLCFSFLPYYSTLHTERIKLILNNNLLFVYFIHLSEIIR